MFRRVFRTVLFLGAIHQQIFFPFYPYQSYANLEEIDLGRKFSLVARAQFPLVRDPVVQQYLRSLGQRLVVRLEQPEFSYQFAVVQDRSLNAFSVPGGYIYLHSGLILRVESDDELAGVLGHEIAHVQGHHMLRQNQDTKLLSYASLIAMALAIINPVLAAGASSATGAVQMKYMRQLEEEADYRGLQYLRQAGFDPHGLPRFLKKMSEEERLNPADVPPYFRSHPLSRDRLNYVENTVSAIKWNHPAPADTFALKHVQAILRTLTEPRARVLADYQRLATEAPNDPHPLALLGVVQLRFNDLAHAQQSLEQASAKGLRLDDELGAVYLRLGQHDLARQAFARLSEIKPDNADAHSQLCQIFWRRGEHARATKECQAAISLDPQLDEPYMTLAQIAQQQSKSGEAHLFLAEAMERQGRLDAAFAQYQQAAALLGSGYPAVEEIKKKMKELEELSSEVGKRR